MVRADWLVTLLYSCCCSSVAVCSLTCCLSSRVHWRCQDTSDPRHFGSMRLVPKCLDRSVPVPNCLADTSAPPVLNCLNLQQTFLLQ